MKIGAIQLQSLLDPEHNLTTIRTMLKEARDQGATAVFLPEVFYSMSDGTKATPYVIQGQDQHYEAIRKLATDYNV